MEQPSVQCASLDTALRSKRSVALPASLSLSFSLPLYLALSPLSSPPQSQSAPKQHGTRKKERRKKGGKNGASIRIRDSDRCSPFPARRLRRRHAAPRSSRCKSSSPPGQSGRLLLPLPPSPNPLPSLPPSPGLDGSLFRGCWMNDRRVVNKCEKNAEAPRSASPAPSTEDETRPELWTTMEGTSLYLPIVILLMQCSPSVPVTVSTNRPKVEVEEFSDAELSCLFHTERDPNPRIEWKKKAKEVSFVYFDGRFRGPFEGRATIDGATVTLHRVTQEDAGEYRCEISASLDTVSLGETNVTLNVLVPPQTPMCEVPASAVTGSAVQLRCRDQQSVPPATYSWFKDNKPISKPRHANATYLINSHTGILEFKAVTKEDSGRYSCLASNGVGSPKMCEAKHMTIEDVNITVILGAVVVVFLLLVVCGCGGMLLHRNGLLTQGHRGRSNVNYVPPPQEPQDFKHTQSFML